MTKIIIPKNNIKERIYILDVLFNEFIGIEYNFELADVQNYKIILRNGKKLIIEDHFFCHGRIPPERNECKYAGRRVIEPAYLAGLVGREHL